MKRYIVSREPDPDMMAPLAWSIDGANDLSVLKSIDYDHVVVEMDEAGIAWLKKYFPACTIQPSPEAT